MEGFDDHANFEGGPMRNRQAKGGQGGQPGNDGGGGKGGKGGQRGQAGNDGKDSNAEAAAYRTGFKGLPSDAFAPPGTEGKAGKGGSAHQEGKDGKAGQDSKEGTSKGVVQYGKDGKAGKDKTEGTGKGGSDIAVSKARPLGPPPATADSRSSSAGPHPISAITPDATWTVDAESFEMGKGKGYWEGWEARESFYKAMQKKGPYDILFDFVSLHEP